MDVIVYNVMLYYKLQINSGSLITKEDLHVSLNHKSCTTDLELCILFTVHSRAGRQ